MAPHPRLVVARTDVLIVNLQYLRKVAHSTFRAVGVHLWAAPVSDKELNLDIHTGV